MFVGSQSINVSSKIKNSQNSYLKKVILSAVENHLCLLKSRVKASKSRVLRRRLIVVRPPLLLILRRDRSVLKNSVDRRSAL